MCALPIRFFSSPPVRFIPVLLQTKPIASKLERIYSHTFNQQLFDGTLSAQAFGKYLHDDYIYLHPFALGLDNLSTKTNIINPKLADLLRHLSTNIISGELAMQRQYGEYFTLTPDSKPDKAIRDYIDFIKTHIELSELPIALCSIVPCFLIYSELGKQKFHKDQLASNPFKQWIEAYSSPIFVEATTLLCDTVNKLAIPATDTLRLDMKKAIYDGIKHELRFFDEVHPARYLEQISIERPYLSTEGQDSQKRCF